ncbi:hypothetical protein LINPERHAP2_LOCUS32222 [Linum perenne]
MLRAKLEKDKIEARKLQKEAKEQCKKLQKLQKEMIFDQTDSLVKVFSGGLLLPITEIDDEIWMRWYGGGGEIVGLEVLSTAAEWGGTAEKRRRLAAMEMIFWSKR